MTDLEKYELINSTKSVEQLMEAVSKIGPIQGSKEEFSVENIHGSIRLIMLRPYYPYYNQLTRKFGLRQQMIYLMTYKKYDRLGLESGASFETKNN